MCTAFLLGFGSGVALSKTKPYCAPDPLEADQLRARVVERLKLNQERTRQDAAAALLEALKAAYPCGK